MKLDIKIDPSVARNPLPAQLFLEEKKQGEFRNVELGLRHPLAIYNVSINTVINAFNTLLDTLALYNDSDHEKRLGDKVGASLVQSTDHLLDAVMEHFDDCENIVKVFYASSEKKLCGKALRNLNQTVRQCRDFVAKQVNAIKHNQGRVRLIEFRNPEIKVIGYFIEGVLADGAIGPNPEVHSGGNTAFSYVRVLRYLLATVIFVSRALVSQLNQRSRVSSPLKKEGLGGFSQVAQRIVALGDYLFPDELDGLIPRIEWQQDKKALIEYPSKSKCGKPPPEPFRINFIHRGDGISRSFKLPYKYN